MPKISGIYTLTFAFSEIPTKMSETVFVKAEILHKWKPRRDYSNEFGCQKANGGVINKSIDPHQHNTTETVGDQTN